MWDCKTPALTCKTPPPLLRSDEWDLQVSSQWAGAGNAKAREEPESHSQTALCSSAAPVAATGWYLGAIIHLHKGKVGIYVHSNPNGREVSSYFIKAELQWGCTEWVKIKISLNYFGRLTFAEKPVIYWWHLLDKWNITAIYFRSNAWWVFWRMV